MKRTDNMVKILGASSHSKEDRESMDFYATDPNSLKLFLHAIKKDGITLNNSIWEPACGDGSISKVLKEYGHTVHSTDVVRRKNFGHIYDFTAKPCFKWMGDILTNPPYKIAQEFVTNSLEYVEDGSLVIMYLRLQFLEGKKRGEMYKKYPPKWIYVHSSRQRTYKNNDVEKYGSKASAVCFAWFMWEKGFTGDPKIRWI